MRSALIAFFVCASAALAQTPLGTVTGLATDPSGAAIPSVRVTLLNTQTGVKRTTDTNESGAYSFPNLAPGTYQLSAQVQSFRPLQTPEFPLQAYRTVRQDLKFEVAAATTEVQVTETASTVIQTDTPSISTGLSTRQLLRLPANVRTVDNKPNSSGDSGLIFTLLPQTVPGVVQVGSGAKWLTPGAGATGMKLKVDGIETDFGNFGSPDPVSQPSMEAIQEFTANVLTNRAEFGGMGTVTTVTRGGTNDWHADLFWYLRNTALDARNTFATNKPFQNIHNYGGTLGGPVRKNKTFFLFDFDGTRGSRAYLITSSVPTLAMRQGDFTGSAALKNPFTGVNPFSGNTILPQFLSQQAMRAQQAFFPLPNYGPPNLTSANYRASFNGPENHDISEIRLDQNWSAQHQSFLRYENKISDWNIPGARLQLPPSSVGTSINQRRMNFWTLGDIYSLRPNLFNEARGGLVILVSKSDADLKGQPVLDQIGIQGLPSRAGIKGLPVFNISGFTATGQTLLNPVNDGHGQWADNLTWIRGRHTMKFGAEMVQWFVNRYLTTTSGLFGNYVFNAKFTGNPYADFLLGLPATVSRLDPWPTQYNRFRDWAVFAQDEFKVAPRLTLSYGLRYEYNGPAYATNDNIYSFDPAGGRIIVPSDKSRQLFSPYFPSTIPITTADQAGLPRGMRNGDGKNFAPRFGFSYQLDSSGRTVLRGGWGMYYSHLSANVLAALSSGPYAVSTTTTNNIVNGQPQLTLANPFVTPGLPNTLNLSAVNPNMRNPYAQQYSLTLERELGRDLGLRVSYIGSKGTQLIYTRNLNQPPASTVKFTAARLPYPLYNQIAWSENGANSLYSGLQVQVQKRFSRGLFFTSAWTWAKELADVDDTGDFELNTVAENSYDRRADRGNVYSVPRHQWMNQAFYELPGRGRILGGWQLSTLLNLSTGNWLTPRFSNGDPSNTNTIGGRPDLVASTINLPHTMDAWFDRTAFAAPPANAGRFGNAGRGIIEGPGYIIFDLGISKTISLERFGRVEAMLNFQNVLNHVNLGEPSMSVDNINGGKIVSTHVFPAAGSPRTGQVGLRWSF